MIFSMKTIRAILGQIRKADQKFSFFNEKDRIMVGVSGGKDSMVLLYALNQYKNFNCVNFEIIPAILDLGFPGFDASEMVKFVESLGLKLHVVDSKEVYQILKTQQKDAPHLPCSICSRMKKAAINNVAHELGCNKVAFAHHGDDAVETLMMNQIFGGRFATFQPKMYLERSGIEFIRPLILCHEDQIARCAKEEHIPVFPSHCPNDGNTMRAEMKKMLKEIYSKYPMAKKNFFSMLENHEKEVLYYQDFFYKIERKDLSLHPVLTVKDSLLEQQLRSKLKINNFDDDRERFIIYRVNKPIGVLSMKITSNSRLICDLEFIRESKKNRENIIKYLESTLEHFDLAESVILEKSNHTELYKTLGYKKARQSGLIKHLK